MELRAVKGMNDILPDEAARWQRLEAAFRAHVRALRLRRGPHAARRAHAALRAADRRDDRRRREGDVLLRAPRRRAHAAPRGHGRRGARVRRAQRPRQGAGHALVLPRPDVPRRAPGARAATASSTRSAASSSATPGPVCDAEMIDCVCAASCGASASRRRACIVNSLGSARHARAVPRRARRRTSTPMKDKLSEDSQRRLETNPLRILDSKDPRDREAAPRRADDPRLLERRRPRALRRPAPPPRRARHAVHGRPDARARPRLLHAHALRVQRRRRRARRAEHARRRRSLRRHGRGARRPRACRRSASRWASSACSRRCHADARANPPSSSRPLGGAREPGARPRARPPRASAFAPRSTDAAGRSRPCSGARTRSARGSA